MPIEHFNGNRSPSLTYTFTVDGIPFDLTGATVKFKMRAERTSTLKVNTAAVIVSPTAGTVRYDWAAIDVDTPGDFIGWWEVTLPSAKIQESPEFIIAIRDHTAADQTVYLEREDLKRMTDLEGTTFVDAYIDLALISASRSIDEITSRRFYPDNDAAQVRYYTPAGDESLPIDDLVTLTSLKADRDGNGVFEETWVLNTDFVLEPLNPAGRPWTRIRRASVGTKSFPLTVRSIELTGKFGWPAVPEAIQQATGLVASRLLKRREAPFGVVGFGPDSEVVRVTRSDPDVMLLLSRYMANPVF
jgi:BppU N-terminal domain